MRNANSRSTNSKPLLLLISGAPGSGKTTLARRLARSFRLPLLTKDDIKETLFDTLGFSDQESSARLGRAAFVLLIRQAQQMLLAGINTLIEANFQRGLAEPDLLPLCSLARPFLIHCEGDPETILQRYEQRALRGERHPGHQDSHAVPRLRELLSSGAYAPIDLGVPTLRANTTTQSEYQPDYGTILAFVRGHATER